MPIVECGPDGEVQLCYEVRGDGFPVLMIAPGGMRSEMSAWGNHPWDLVGDLAGNHRVVLMDQRNAGRSTAPVRASDGWQRYTEDQLALLDHLQIERCHVVGMCIGGPYGFGLIEAAPERIASAVLFQPIGLDGNRQAFYDMFDSWAREQRVHHPEASEAAWGAFRERMYGGDFLFNVDRGFVAACPRPVLIYEGDDLYHPLSTSRAILELAPDVSYVERWKAPETHAAARATLRQFLASHEPA